MKIMTIVDTSSQIIKLSLTINKLSKHSNHILIYTGQTSDDEVNPSLFKDLNLKEPEYYLAIQADSPGEQIGKILIETEKIIIA
jgi:UDP-N-acetylglucosamine 2-epimerase